MLTYKQLSPAKIIATIQSLRGYNNDMMNLAQKSHRIGESAQPKL